MPSSKHIFAGCAPLAVCCAVLCSSACAVLLCVLSVLWSVHRQMKTEIGRSWWSDHPASGASEPGLTFETCLEVIQRLRPYVRPMVFLKPQQRLFTSQAAHSVD